MLNKIDFHFLALLSMAISIIAGGIAGHAPAAFPYLWEVKTVADVFGASGLAALFLRPTAPAEVPPSSDTPKAGT